MLKKYTFLALLIIHHIVLNAQMDDKFYFPQKKLQPIEWENTEELFFEIDTDTISTIILRPKSKPKATIFYFHGAGGNITYYVPLTKILLEDNFQIVMVDFRGYGKSSGTPTHKNIATDGKLIFKTLLEKKGIKETPKIIYGISIGTQIATLLAKTYQNKINGLVLEGSMASFTEIAMYHVPEYSEFLKTNYISPYAAMEDIKNLKEIPKLIIHSKEDKDVPFTQGKTVFDNAPEPKEFMEFKGKHLYGLKHKKKQILKKIHDMVDKS